MNDELEPGRNGTHRRSPLPQRVDVVVVGAGLAGLSTARELAAAGLEPLVLEARDRVGGRVLSVPIGAGAAVELGGQWVTGHDDHLRRLAADFGIGLFPTYDRGAQLIEVGARIRRQHGAVPPLRLSTLLDVAQARFRLERAAAKVPSDTPWTARRARQWDAQTVESWMRRVLHTQQGRAILDVAVSTIWGGSPAEVNLLQALAHVHKAGGFDALTATEGGFLQDRVVGGSGRLTDALALALGERVVLNAPVRSVTGPAGRMTVTTQDDRTVQAQRVVVTVPPVLRGAIDFDPVLPAPHQEAARRLPMGALIKVAAVYDRPFWRDQGLSGQAVTTEGPVTATFDNSPIDGSPGVLIGFMPGRRARSMARSSAAERRDAALATFARLFGPTASTPIGFHELDWAAEIWTQGCYFGLAEPGLVSGPLRVLREPVGGVHWAGAETTFENYGGMEGAVLSGRRAAGEITATLSRAQRSVSTTP